jgi:hypothetical protein
LGNCLVQSLKGSKGTERKLDIRPGRIISDGAAHVADAGLSCGGENTFEKNRVVKMMWILLY